MKEDGAVEETSSESSEKEEESEYIYDAVMNKTYLRRRFLGKVRKKNVNFFLYKKKGFSFRTKGNESNDNDKKFNL